MPTQQLDLQTQRSVLLEGLKTEEAAKFERFLKRIDRLVREQLTRAELTTYSRDRLEDFLSRLDGKLLDIYKQFSSVVQADLVDIALYEAGFEARALAQAGIDAILPADAAIKAAIWSAPLQIKGPDGGKLLKVFMRDWTRTETMRVTSAIRIGFVQGQTNAQMVQTIRGTAAANFTDGVLAVSNRNARSVVNTAVQAVATAARMETAQANKDVVLGVRLVATLDRKTSTQCKTMDGQEHPLNSGPRPPFHINCLPGDAYVSAGSGIAGVSKRWFDGEMVVFKTASGRMLTCTPNHPILSVEGWVPAESLDLGDNIVCDGSSKWAGVVDRNNEDMPARIHEVVESFLDGCGVMSCPVPVSAPDFHGDGEGSEVAIIGADRVLGSGVYAAINEHREKLGLVLRYPAPVVLIRSGTTSFLFSRVRSASNCVMRFLGKALSFFRRGNAHPSKLLFTPVADGNAILNQDSFDRCFGDTEMFGDAAHPDPGVVHSDDLVGASCDASSSCGTHRRAGLGEDSIYNSLADAELARNLRDGRSGEVFIDQVVSIERRRFAGHVYNLDTVEGWYSAEGIITHNCRTTFILMTKQTARFLKGATRASVGADGGGQVSAGLDYYQWLKTQPAWFQDQALGPVRGKLFRDGGVSAETFAKLQLDSQFRPITLKRMKELEPEMFKQAGIG